MQKKRDLIVYKIIILESLLVFDIDLGSSVGFGPRCTENGTVCQSAIPHVREPIDSFVKVPTLTCNKYSINVY